MDLLINWARNLCSQIKLSVIYIVLQKPIKLQSTQFGIILLVHIILKWVNNKMRDSYNKKMFSDSMNDSRKTWGYINELKGRNRDQKISLVSDNGNRVNDVKLPNYVNDYFVSSV